MSSVKKITVSKDSNFSAKLSKVAERSVSTDVPVPEFSASKKNFSHTKSELKSQSKFCERMTNSRTASAEKFNENSTNMKFTASKCSKNISTIKKIEDEDKENVDTINIDLVNSKPESKIQHIEVVNSEEGSKTYLTSIKEVAVLDKEE